MFNEFFIGIGDVGVLNANSDNDLNQYMPRKTNCTLMFEPINGDTIWYGMVWYGMVWYGMVWYGNILFDKDN